MMLIDPLLDKGNWIVEKIGNFIEAFRSGVGAWIVNILDRVAGAKVFLVFTVCWGMMRLASTLMVTVYNKFLGFRDTVSGLSVSVGGVGSLLAKVNSILPVAEGFVLLAALGGIWVAALGLRWVLAAWKAVPLKAS